MAYYLPFIFIPAFIVVVITKFLFPHKVTWKEWGLQGIALLIGTLISVTLIAAAGMSRTSDFSIFSGYVTGKESVKVSCEHQYKCGETCSMVSSTDSKGKVTQRNVCTPIYCDEHDYDVDWDIKTTLGTWTVRREDRRGLVEPVRWEIAELNEPVQESRYVTNYLLMNPDRFKTTDQIRKKFISKLFGYPRPYDLYRYNRVLTDDGQDYDDIAIWLNEKLKVDGSKHQLNIILVVTRNDADYYYALMEYWQGARKNDVILFYGVDESGKIQWAKATAFAEGQNNQILLKELQTMTYEQSFGIELVQKQYQKIVSDFHRVPNKTFEYMKTGWTPPTWWVVVTMLLNLCFSIGVAVLVVKEKVA